MSFPAAVGEPSGQYIITGSETKQLQAMSSEKMVYNRELSTVYQRAKMSLNIKNDQTHRRAKELARITGETMTQAIDRAIAERLERIRRRRNRTALAERILQTGRECAALPVTDRRASEEALYNERGEIE